MCLRHRSHFLAKNGTNVNTTVFQVPTPEFARGAGVRVQGLWLETGYRDPVGIPFLSVPRQFHCFAYLQLPASDTFSLFVMPWRYQVCITKYLDTSRVKITAQKCKTFTLAGVRRSKTSLIELPNTYTVMTTPFWASTYSRYQYSGTKCERNLSVNCVFLLHMCASFLSPSPLPMRGFDSRWGLGFFSEHFSLVLNIYF